MANRLLILFLLLGFSCSGPMKEANDDDSFQVVSISNRVVEDSLRHYYQRNLKEYSKGIVTITMLKSSDTTSFIISSTLSTFGIQTAPPTFYGELDGIPFLIYTGFESEVLMNRNYVNQVLTKIGPFLDEVPPNYNPVVWQVMTVSQEVVGSKVLN